MYTWSDIKATVVNQALPSLHEGAGGVPRTVLLSSTWKLFILLIFIIRCNWMLNIKYHLNLNGTKSKELKYIEFKLIYNVTRQN